MNSHHSTFSTWLKNHRLDFISGALVFLVALPLCLGISLASGYPAISGIITAGVGGILTAVLSDSPLTIKGPAAGLIVIALGCIADFGFTQGANLARDFSAYRMALAIGVVAGGLQIVLGLLRLGFITELFPFSVIHGMLAAIGFIIIFKQIPVALGLDVSGPPLELAVKIVKNIKELNPEIATIGILSLAILILCSKSKNHWLKRIPAPMLVLLLTVPLAHYFDLEHEHTYSWHHQVYYLSPKFLVTLPKNILGAIVLPDFSALKDPRAFKWILLFSLIGSIESLVSVQAIDLLDPQKRKTNRNRDLLAIGIANTLVAFLGGLPMISEIVRSRANIDNGAQTSVSNGFHGFCLLFFVALFPGLLHRIPLSALAAMLIFTGYRLASPLQFKQIRTIGWDQLVIFVSTIVATLATDLLVGLGMGILVKFVIHLSRGVLPHHLVKPKLQIEHNSNDNTITIKPQSPLVFLNWLSIKKQLNEIKTGKRVVLDVSACPLVDHSVMERLHELACEHQDAKGKLDIVGLDAMIASSEHPFASRRNRKVKRAPHVPH
ncbi:MAG: SulP family inorganic anion transporter [Proteobacteria bacterium]|nr:SulP family inorganic anion transporter [Pseudomonadota bacterium]